MVAMTGTTETAEQGHKVYAKRTRRKMQDTGKGARWLLLGAEQWVISESIESGGRTGLE